MCTDIKENLQITLNRVSYLKYHSRAQNVGGSYHRQSKTLQASKRYLVNTKAFEQNKLVRRHNISFSRSQRSL